MDIRNTEISLIIPTYNERENIIELLNRLKFILEDKNYEVIVVDDNSPDLTWELVQGYARNNPFVKLIRRTGRRSLTASVIEGFQNSKGNILGVMDADMSHDPAIMPEMIDEINNGYSLVIGSRRIKGGGADSWPWHRRLYSSTAILLVRWLLDVNVQDSMSGYFFIKREIFENVKDDISGKGYKILLELLIRSKVKKIKEIPYIFKDRKQGYIKLSMRVIADFFKTIYKLKLAMGQNYNLSIVNLVRRKYHYGRYYKVGRMLKNGSLLDVGCGKPTSFFRDGEFIKYIGRGIGLDKKHCKDIRYIQGDICGAPFGDNFFDNVVAMEVIEHLEDFDKAIAEICRIAKPDSHIIISTPNNSLLWKITWFILTNSFSKEWRDSHVNNFNIREWTKRLENYFIIKKTYNHWNLDLIFELRVKKE